MVVIESGHQGNSRYLASNDKKWPSLAVASGYCIFSDRSGRLWFYQTVLVCKWTKCAFFIRHRIYQIGFMDTVLKYAHVLRTIHDQQHKASIIAYRGSKQASIYCQLGRLTDIKENHFQGVSTWASWKHIWFISILCLKWNQQVSFSFLITGITGLQLKELTDLPCSLDLTYVNDEIWHISHGRIHLTFHA